MSLHVFTAIPPVRGLTSPLKLVVGLVITIAGPAMALAGSL